MERLILEARYAHRPRVPARRGLRGVTPTDPLTFGGAAMALLVVGVLATLVPAVRASCANPALVLRTE